MIKKLSFFIAIVFPLIVHAQYTISVQLPPAGMIQKDQLWNLVLVNNSSSMPEVNIMLQLQDAVTGQMVLSAATRSILLAKGAKILSVQDIQPVHYNYGSSGYSGNYLPLGAYIACYTITRNTIKQTETLSNECVRVNINPLSPPLLNTPADKSVLRTITPQFSWTPPAPIDMFENLNYEIGIAEVLDGQSPAEAIRQNPPLYVNTHLRLPYENYPSTFSKLETGKTYAWRVAARNGFSYAAHTEVWTFSIAEDTNKVESTSVHYLLLKNKRNEGGVNVITGNNLFIKYYSFDRERETVIRIYSTDKQLVYEEKRQIVYGDNFLQIRLNRRFDKGVVYFIEIPDRRDNVYTASFSIK